MNTIPHLCSTLKELLGKRQNGFQLEVKQAINEYVESKSDDWREFAIFNPHKYCRNLIEINPDFEMIVICWDKNQESPIHNHSSQNCWFGVLEGTMEEVTYTFDPSLGLEEKSTQQFTKGDVGWISDDNGIHKVRSCNDQVGITLHIYSKPIPMCLIYCPITNSVTVRRMGFFTVKGKKCVDASDNCYKKLYEELMKDQNCDSSYKALFQPF